MKFLLAFLLMVSAAHAKPRVHILAVDSDYRIFGLKTRMMKSGLFSRVLSSNSLMGDSFPSDKELANVDVLLIWHRVENPAWSVRLGDLLARWVQKGRGVVFSAPSHRGAGYIRGLFGQANLYPFANSVIDLKGASRREGKRHLRNHSILKNVPTIEDRSNSVLRNGFGSLHKHARSVVDWDDGVPMVAILEALPGKMVELGFDLDLYYSHKKKGMYEVMINALAWAATKAVPKKKVKKVIQTPKYDLSF